MEAKYQERNHLEWMRAVTCVQEAVLCRIAGKRKSVHIAIWQTQTCLLCRVIFGKGARLGYALSCSHLQATLRRLPIAMTPIYPEGFIQIVPFAPFAAEIFNLMGTACVLGCVQCSQKQCALPDWVAWPEVGVSQFLIV